MPQKASQSPELDIERAPRLEDLTHAELLELFRELHGEPTIYQLANAIYDRLQAETKRVEASRRKAEKAYHAAREGENTLESHIKTAKAFERSCSQWQRESQAHERTSRFLDLWIAPSDDSQRKAIAALEAERRKLCNDRLRRKRQKEEKEREKILVSLWKSQTGSEGQDAEQ